MSAATPNARFIEPLVRTLDWTLTLERAPGELICPEHKVEHTGKSADVVILAAELFRATGKTRFREIAIAEGQSAATVEIDEQIAESREHAEGFRDRLSAAQVDKAARKFAALTRIEQRHAAHYADRLACLVC